MSPVSYESASDLVEFHDGPVHFHLRASTQAITHLTLTNITSHPVAYKIKTTSPQRYCVRPNSDILPTGTAIDIELVFLAVLDPPSDTGDRCRDKFQLLVAPAPDNHETTGKALADFWNRTSKDQIRQAKFTVVLDVTNYYKPSSVDGSATSTGVEQETEAVEDESLLAAVAANTGMGAVVASTGTAGAAAAAVVGGGAAMAAAAATESMTAPDVVDVSEVQNRPVNEVDRSRSVLADAPSNASPPVSHMPSLHSLQSAPMYDPEEPSPPNAPRVVPPPAKTKTLPSSAVSSAGGGDSRPDGLGPLGAVTLSNAQSSLERKTGLEQDVQTSESGTAVENSPELGTRVEGLAGGRVGSAWRMSFPDEGEKEEGARVIRESERRVIKAVEAKDKAVKAIGSAGAAAAGVVASVLAAEAGSQNDLYSTAAPDMDALDEAARERVLAGRSAPQVQLAELGQEEVQRAAVERAGQLWRLSKSRDAEIATLCAALAEANHKLADAKMAVLPAYDVKYEIDESTGVPFAQVAIMAAISGVILGLFI